MTDHHSRSAEDADSAAARLEPRRRVPLHIKIVIGLIVGGALGLAGNWAAHQPATAIASNHADLDANGLDDRLDWLTLNLAEPVGKIFLRLMFMVVLPLVFSALALAVVEIGDVRRLGRVGLRTLLFTAILSSIAVLLGITLVGIVKPGHSLSPETRDRLEQRYRGPAAAADAAKPKPLRAIVVDLFPENPLQEMVGAIDGSSKGNGMLAVMVFALIFGAAITAAPGPCATLVGWLEGLNAVSMVVIGWAMRLAPVGAGCLVFAMTAQLGIDVLLTLLWFVLTVLAGLALHLLVTYPVVL
ncbi:MAG TPA: cation:dicarboxylase symporter family transporter, partial [Pirellulales bacterium]|nr:cation:dicarboxylase symporter family transporter [Pirellulales bacterium]